MAGAAAAASNPDKPPFYLDMPFEMVDDEAQIVAEVAERVNATDCVHDVDEYLQQPTRLNGLMIYHGESDPFVDAEVVRGFDALLTEQGIEHEYLEVPGGHCDLRKAPVLQFMADHLAFEMVEEAATPATPERILHWRQLHLLERGHRKACQRTGGFL